MAERSQSQRRIKEEEEKVFRWLKDDWDREDFDHDDTPDCLREVANLRREHSEHFYGGIDEGHQKRIDWMEDAADEYERRRDRRQSYQSPVKTRRMLQSNTAPASPIKSPALLYHRDGIAAMRVQRPR